MRNCFITPKRVRDIPVFTQFLLFQPNVELLRSTQIFRPFPASTATLHFPYPVSSPLPQAKHLIDLQPPGYLMRNKQHRHLYLELVDGSGEAFRRLRAAGAARWPLIPSRMSALVVISAFIDRRILRGVALRGNMKKVRLGGGFVFGPGARPIWASRASESRRAGAGQGPGMEAALVLDTGWRRCEPCNGSDQ